MRAPPFPPAGGSFSTLFGVYRNMTDEHDDAGPRGRECRAGDPSRYREALRPLQINEDVPLYGLMRDDGEGEQRTVLTRTIVRVICKAWKQESAGEDVR